MLSRPWQYAGKGSRNLQNEREVDEAEDALLTFDEANKERGGSQEIRRNAHFQGQD